MIDGVRYYFYTKTNSVPLKDVIEAVEKFFVDKNKFDFSIEEIYGYIKEYFNVKVFNRDNLSLLLETEGESLFGGIKKINRTMFCKDVDHLKNKKQKEKQYYNITKTVRVPLDEVIDRVYNFFITRNLKVAYLRDVYDDLCTFFNLSSFNYRNLELLFNAKSKISFEVVQELYFNIKADDSVKGVYNFSLLSYIFIEKRLSILKVLQSLGLEAIQKMLDEGIDKFVEVLDMFSMSATSIFDLFSKEEICKPNNAKMLSDFLNLFSYEEWESLLTNPENLDSYLDMFIEDKNQELEKLSFKSYLLSYYECIHKDNLRGRIKYLFDSHISNIFVENKIEKIEDIINITDELAFKLYNYKDTVMRNIIDMKESYIKRCQTLFRYCYQFVNKNLVPNSLWENYVAILEKRADNLTLKQVGEEFGLTRQRIKQIEFKYDKSFKEYCLKYNLLNLIRAFVDNPLFITNDDICKIISERYKLFKFLLGIKEDDNIFYIEEIDKFYFQDEYDWYKYINEYIDLMPDQIPSREMGGHIAKVVSYLNEKKVNIEYVDCEKIILNTYKLKGVIYSKSTMSVSTKFKHVISNYYNEAYDIYDEKFINEFRKNYDIMFKEEIKSSDHAIASILQRISTQVGRGLYVLTDKTLISEKLANTIYEYILNNERDIYLTNNLYAIFENELKAEGIENKYHMQGALRQRLSDKLYFRRDYISKDSSSNTIYNDIANYVKKYQRVISYEEIQSEFKGITDIVLLTALSQESILNYRKKYVHVDNFEIEQSDIEFLKETLSTFLNDNAIHHVIDLFSYVKLVNRRLLDKFYIEDYFALYSLLEYLFSDMLEMKRPYIANKGIIIENQIDRINEFVNSYDEVDIQFILNFVSDNKLKLASILEYVDSLNNYVLKNQNTIFTVEKSNLNKYNVEMVENLIIKTMGNQDFIYADKLTFYSIMPKEVKWNPWLLYSAINKFGNKLKAISSSNVFKKKGRVRARPIIINRDIPAKNKDELIEYLKHKMNLNDNDLYHYLQSKELV